MSRCVGNKIFFRHTKKYVQYKTSTKNVHQQPICIADSYLDNILDEIMRREHIKYENHIQNDDSSQ